MSDSVWPHRQKPTRLPRPWDSPGKKTGVACHFLLQRMKVKSEREVTQSCPTLRNRMDCSLPGSSVHGISRQEYWSGMTLPSPGTTTGRAYYCFQTCVLTFTFLPMQNAILILFSNLRFSLIQFKPHLLPQLAPYLHHYSLCHSILILFTLFFSLTDMLLGKHSPLVS